MKARLESRQFGSRAYAFTCYFMCVCVCVSSSHFPVVAVPVSLWGGFPSFASDSRKKEGPGPATNSPFIPKAGVLGRFMTPNNRNLKASN